MYRLQRNRVKEWGEAVLMLLWWAFNPYSSNHHNGASYPGPCLMDQGSWNTQHGPGIRDQGTRIRAEKCLKCGNNETKVPIRVLTDKKEMKKKKMLKESV